MASLLVLLWLITTVRPKGFIAPNQQRAAGSLPKTNGMEELWRYNSAMPVSMPARLRQCICEPSEDFHGAGLAAAELRTG